MLNEIMHVKHLTINVLCNSRDNEVWMDTTGVLGNPVQCLHIFYLTLTSGAFTEDYFMVVCLLG